MRETIAMREIIANAEGVREVKAKCVSLPQNAGDLATLQLVWAIFSKVQLRIIGSQYLFFIDNE